MKSAVTAKRKMTYGDAQAIKVLAAERLGLEVWCVDTARAMLRGDPVHAMRSAAVSAEGHRVHNQLCGDARKVSAANIHSEAIRAEYGF